MPAANLTAAQTMAKRRPREQITQIGAGSPGQMLCTSSGTPQANEDRLLSALSPAEQEQLAGLLRRLLTSFEDSQANAAGPLGVELYPAHIARSRRHAVGLSDPPGMLVAAPPLPGTPAADAGLRQGDLTTAINDREIRSVCNYRNSPAVINEAGGPPRAKSTSHPGHA